MDLLWIVVGLMAFCMPHLSASTVGASFVWSGLPYPAELLVVFFILAVLALVEIPPAVKERLSTASLVASTLLVLFECACGVMLPGLVGDLTLAFVGEMAHALAVGLWLLHASLGDGQRSLGTHVSSAACGLLAASGVAWYVVVSVVRVANASWSPQVEVALWLATLAWVLPLLVVFWSCNLAPRQFALLAAMPFAGVLLGNRIWWLVHLFVQVNLDGVPATLLVVVAPVLSAAGLVTMWVTGGTDNQVVCSTDPSGTNNLVICSTSVSTLPLHRLSGYDTLSEREREVLLLALEGKSATQIAQESELARTTVYTYLARAYEKLGVAGSQELLDMLRQSIQGVTEPAPEDVDNDTPQLAPALIIAIPTATIIFASTAAGLIPSGGLRSIVGFVLGLVALVVGIARLRDVRSCPIWSPLCGLLVGASIALVTTSVAFGPSLFLVQRALVALVVVAVSLVLVRQAKSIMPAVAPLTCFFTGLVAVCLVPQGIRAQTLLHNLAPLPLAAAVLLIAYLLVRRARNDELASVAAAALMGDERILAYLTGRGLKDLVAQVALLTARDYPLGGIAATLSLSRPTVTNYRKRAYEALDVSNKAELIELLEKEAGLRNS